jgi:hypothetical protein
MGWAAAVTGEEMSVSEEREQDLLERYEERAAICEFCGGMSRARAEAMAREEVAKLRRIMGKKALDKVQ